MNRRRSLKHYVVWGACAVIAVACGNRTQLRGFLAEAGPDPGGTSTSGGGGPSMVSTMTIDTVTSTLTTTGAGNFGVGGATMVTSVNTVGSSVTGSGGCAAEVPGTELLELPFYEQYVAREAPPYTPTEARPPPLMGVEFPVVLFPCWSLRYVTPALFGNNAAVWNGDESFLTDLMQKRLSDVSVSMLRFPGGSTSDTYHFDGVYPTYAVDQGWDVMSEPWAVSTAEYMGVVRRIGATPLITVNHGYASYDTTESDGNVENAARLASDWVEYCNAENDGSNPSGGVDWAARRADDGYEAPFNVRYWEVGNEAYGGWEVGYDPTGTGYAEHFLEIAKRMKSVDPDIFIGLVVDPSYQDWTRIVLSTPGVLDLTDFLVVHNYFGWIGSTSDLDPDSMLARTSQVREYKEQLDYLVAQARPGRPLPYYLGEYNLPLPTHSYQIAHIAAVFIAEVLGQLTLWDWAGASLWDVQNEYDPGSGLGAGDNGFLSFRQPGLPDLTPRPSYYPFYFFTHHLGNVFFSFQTNGEEVSVYPSHFQDDAYGIVLVNRTSTARLVSLSFAGRPTPSRGNLWVLDADSADSTKTRLNGVENDLIAGGPELDAVEPYAVDFADVPIVSLPPYSVASLLLYP